MTQPKVHITDKQMLFITRHLVLTLFVVVHYCVFVVTKAATAGDVCCPLCNAIQPIGKSLPLLCNLCLIYFVVCYVLLL